MMSTTDLLRLTTSLEEHGHGRVQRQSAAQVMAPAEPKTPKDTQGGALALLTTTTSIRMCGIQDGVVY